MHKEPTVDSLGITDSRELKNWARITRNALIVVMIGLLYGGGAVLVRFGDSAATVLLGLMALSVGAGILIMCIIKRS